MNPLVKKLERKFNDFILKTIFKKLEGLSPEELRKIARSDYLKGCTNEVQKFIGATLSGCAEVVLKAKFGIDLEPQKTVQE